MISICVLTFATMLSVLPNAYKCWDDPDGEAVTNFSGMTTPGIRYGCVTSLA